MNGTIASIATPVADPFTGGVSFYSILPPSLFRSGHNNISVAIINGTPTDPHLEPVTLAS